MEELNNDVLSQEEIESQINTINKELQEQNMDSDTPPKLIDEICEEDHVEIENAVFEYLYEELTNNPLQYASENFYQQLVYDLSDLLLSHWYDVYDEDDVHYFMYIQIMTFFQIYDEFPHRSYVEYNGYMNLHELADQIQKLRNTDQPPQRTEEWYKYRNGLLTASNMWKIFNTEAQLNSLIYEKCKGHDRRILYGSVQWGNVFEPLSIKIYEMKYNTTVEDFGCIQHPKYKYIGASPDGINVEPNSEKFGRMLEVKNIYNREIKGIPKEEYWIQMQIQMETCNLDVCDFLETRFIEYSEEEYYEDTRELKGIVMYFAEDNGPDMKYLYKPLGMTDRKEINRWQSDQCDSMMVIGYSKTRVVYWYLDEFSCVAVTRHRNWFEKALPYIENVYNTIQEEKEKGFEHRAPKKMKKTITVTHTDQSDNQLIHNLEVQRRINLIKLDSNGESTNNE